MKPQVNMRTARLAATRAAEAYYNLSYSRMSEDHEFKKHIDEALTALQRDLVLAGDDYGFDSSLRGGTITISFHAPSVKFTVAADDATGQIKVATASRSYKLDWDIVENAFVHTESHQTLKELLELAISKQLKKDVEL
ncbi:MAG: frataxin domain-containing protein [Bryobacteraceae bacterium]|jgi:frataxin-like iron-binding protein CyaY